MDGQRSNPISLVDPAGQQPPLVPLSPAGTSSTSTTSTPVPALIPPALTPAAPRPPDPLAPLPLPEIAPASNALKCFAQGVAEAYKQHDLVCDLVKGAARSLAGALRNKPPDRNDILPDRCGANPTGVPDPGCPKQ